MKTNLILIAVFVAITPSILFGQGSKEPKSAMDSISLGAVEITATRSKTRKENLPQQIEVITTEEIKNTGAKDLLDVLKKNAGVDVIQYQGLLSGIGIRGFRPSFSGINQRSLLLIDGRPAGSTNFATIDLNNVERIEVVKGPSSSLYGSQAMGGVVNVITKKSSGDIKKSLYASFGSFNTVTAGLMAGGSLHKKSDFDFNLNYFEQGSDYRQGGDNVFRNRYNWDKATNTYYNSKYEIDSVKTVTDKSGDGEVRLFTKYKYQSGQLRFGYVINDKWRADINGNFFSANNVQNPGDIANGTTSQSLKNPYRYALHFTVNGRIGNHHDLVFKLYKAIEYSDNRTVSNSTPAKHLTSSNKNNWEGFQLQDNIRIRKHVLTVGIDNSNVSTASRSWNSTTGVEKAPYSPNYGIYSKAAFANATFNLLAEKLIATIGGRFDHITFDVRQTPYLETFKSAKEAYSVFNPSAGIKYKFKNNIHLHASAGKAFVTPDAFAVAGYAVSGPGALPSIKGKVSVTSGNPDLKPESSVTIDGGIGYLNHVIGLEADITYFNTAVSNRITTGQSTLPTSIELTDEGDTIASRITYINSDKSFMQGLEAELSYNLGALADFAYTFKIFANVVKYIQLDERIRHIPSGIDYTRKIYNVADQTISGGLEYGNDKYRARLSARHVGKRYDTDWNDFIKRPEIEYSSFMILDLSTSFQVKHGEITVQVNNITDENYYEKRGYNMPGRNLMLKYTHHF